MRQPRNFATDRCCHLVSRIANRAFYLSAEAGGWRTTFLRFSPKGQGGRSRFATCSDFPVRTTSRRSTLRRCARRATLHRLARRIRIRLGWSTRSRRRGVGRSRMGGLLHHSPLHQRGQTLCSLQRFHGARWFHCVKSIEIEIRNRERACTHARAGYWRRDWRCRQIYARKSKKFSMDGNAEAEPCTRKLAWFSSETCMVGLRNLHGSTRQLAWLDFATCMVGLFEVHGSASGTAWMD